MTPAEAGLLFYTGLALSALLYARYGGRVLRFCWAHRGRVLSVLCVVFCVVAWTLVLATTYEDPITHESCVSCVWGIMALLSLFPASFSTIWWDWGEKPQVEKPKPLPPGLLNIPRDYFMPYCVCPGCHAEALHWLEPARPESIYDVKRTCVVAACESTWYQRVGLLGELVS